MFRVVAHGRIFDGDSTLGSDQSRGEGWDVVLWKDWCATNEWRVRSSGVLRSIGVMNRGCGERRTVCTLGYRRWLGSLDLGVHELRHYGLHQLQGIVRNFLLFAVGYAFFIKALHRRGFGASKCCCCTS
jgi:hypothetical protein